MNYYKFRKAVVTYFMDNSFYKNFNRLERISSYHETECLLLSESIINQRLKVKKYLGENVVVIFICHRPQVWNSLKTVYRSFLEDDLFEVYIVRIPIRRCSEDGGWLSNVYDLEDKNDFWEGVNCIDGYDSENNSWFDPKTLNPDYVFYQQPYNVMFHDYYKSWIVSKYAKICYTPYYFAFSSGDVMENTKPVDFIKNLSFFFVQDNYYKEKVLALKSANRIITGAVEVLGMPRLDLLRQDSVNKRDRYSILWLPRWTFDEGTSHFLEYKGSISDYCEENDVSYILRPHPQMFRELTRIGLMSNSQLEEFVNSIQTNENAFLDENTDYIETFYESDCLVADYTSLLIEYLFTGKPIIYCHRTNVFDDFGNRIAEGFYWANNWDEVSGYLDMLRRGEDPLLEKRQQLVKEIFAYNDGKNGERIKEYIKADALK